MEIGSDFLSMDGSLQVAIQAEWESFRWVYVYYFSDSGSGERGVGAYVPRVNAEKYETNIVPALDLTPYEGSYGMRIGSRVSGTDSLHYIAKMQHFKGVAIHYASVVTIEDLV